MRRISVVVVSLLLCALFWPVGAMASPLFEESVYSASWGDDADLYLEINLSGVGQVESLGDGLYSAQYLGGDIRFWGKLIMVDGENASDVRALAKLGDGEPLQYPLGVDMYVSNRNMRVDLPFDLAYSPADDHPTSITAEALVEKCADECRMHSVNITIYLDAATEDEITVVGQQEAETGVMDAPTSVPSPTSLPPTVALTQPSAPKSGVTIAAQASAAQAPSSGGSMESSPSTAPIEKLTGLTELLMGDLSGLFLVVGVALLVAALVMWIVLSRDKKRQAAKEAQRRAVAAQSPHVATPTVDQAAYPGAAPPFASPPPSPNAPNLGGTSFGPARTAAPPPGSMPPPPAPLGFSENRSPRACVRCGHLLRPDLRYCTHCGAEQPLLPTAAAAEIQTELDQPYEPQPSDQVVHREADAAGRLASAAMAPQAKVYSGLEPAAVSPLVFVCPHCGEPSDAREVFCRVCGQPLHPEPVDETPMGEMASSLELEEDSESSQTVAAPVTLQERVFEKDPAGDPGLASVSDTDDLAEPGALDVAEPPTDEPLQPESLDAVAQPVEEPLGPESPDFSDPLAEDLALSGQSPTVALQPDTENVQEPHVVKTEPPSVLDEPQAVSDESSVSAMAPRTVDAPAPSRAELVIGVVPSVERIKAGRRQMFNLVLTSHRLLFARLTGSMLRQAATQARESVADLSSATSMAGLGNAVICDRYRRSTPDDILEEHEDNFGVTFASVQQIEVIEATDDDDSEVMIIHGLRELAFTLPLGAAGETRRTLRGVLGDDVV